MKSTASAALAAVFCAALLITTTACGGGGDDVNELCDAPTAPAGGKTTPAEPCRGHSV